MAEESSEVDLPDKPEEPLDSDCCGTGCSPCVFDVHEQDLTRWRAECERIRNGGKETVENELALRKDQYMTFTIEDIQQVTEDSFLYRFHIPNNGTLGLTVGQHVVLRGTTIDGKHFSRQYTPVSCLKAKGYFEVLIKIYPDGKMSRYIKQWAVGDDIPWRGPYGVFTYKPNTYRHIVMFCAGTGIAPILQVIRHIVENEDDETLLRLHYSCKTYKDILCKPSLDMWSGFWNFGVTYYLTQEVTGQSKVKYGDKVHYHRLDEDKVKTTLEDFNCDQTLVLICGTKSFDKDMINYAKGVGFVNFLKF